jgi:DNA invertase Pin-like site-specific DNA recombinase
MATGFSYIRFSSPKQQHGHSLIRQIELSKQYCESNGLKFSEDNFQDLGISGFSGSNRPQLQQMLEAIGSGKIEKGDYIILENLDRLSRQGISDTQAIITKILKAEVKIVCLHERLELDKDSVNDLTSVIRIAVSADIGHKSSLEKSKRVKAAKNAQKEAARKGLPIKKRLSYWLKMKTDNTGYEFNENEEVIRHIVKLRQDGNGFQRIAIILNNTTDYKPTRARAWSSITVTDFIKSPALYGTYQTNILIDGKYVPDPDGTFPSYFPAIVSFNEWKLLQPNFITHIGGHSKHNHLAGLVRCSRCGSAMTKKTSKRKTKTRTIHYKHWICIGSKDGSCDERKGIRDLDDIIIKTANRLKVTEVNKDNTLDLIEQEIEITENKIRDIKHQLETLNAVSPTAVSVLTKLEAELSKLSEKKNRAFNISKNDIRSLLDYKEDPIKFNLHLKRLVESIVVTRRSSIFWQVLINQRDGNNIKITVSRSKERSPFKIGVSASEDFETILANTKETSNY